MGRFLGKYPCIKCPSSDAMAVYDEGEFYGAKCYSCEETFTNNQLASSELGEELGIETTSRTKEIKKKVPVLQKRKERKPIIDGEKLEQIRHLGKPDDTKYRGLSKAVNVKYDVITHYDESGVTKRFYPVTQDGMIVGLKGRGHPKDFFSSGRNDNQVEMFGQSLFPNGGKWLVITGGEEDAMAAYEMLWRDQYSRSGDKYPPIAVVSPTTGETSAAIQVANNYEWIEKFENIVIMFDNDEAGRKGTQDLLEVLPMGKVKIATLTSKDPNKMLQEGKQKEFMQCFWTAKQHNPAGVVGSNELVERILARAKLEKIPLPKFAWRLQKMMAGGIPLGYIINLAAASGIGKSTLVNEFIYFWIFHSPYRVGVISLESDPGEYGELLLSRHMGKKLALIETVAEKLAFLEQGATKEAMNELFFDSNGDPRFHVVDHQGSVGEEELKKKCEYLVRVLKCKLLIIDPLTLALTGNGNDETDGFMAWQKNFVSQHQVVFVNVVHIRKNSGNQQANSQGASISEEMIKGSGSIFQVAGANVLLMRDKEAADIIARNTTRSVMSKCRWTGITGPSGDWYYDNETHIMHDFDTYWEEYGDGETTLGDFEEDSILFQPIIEADAQDKTVDTI